MGELDGQDDVNIDDVVDNTIVETGNEKPVEETATEETATEETATEETATEETATEEKPVEEKPVEVDPVQKKINKFYYEKKTAEEALIREKALREEAEANLAEATKEIIPPIPEIPSTMDPDYAKKMEERDALIVKHAQQDANKAALEHHRLEGIKAENEAAAIAHKETVNECYTKAKELGLDKTIVDDSQNKVGASLPGKQELCNFLLKGDPLNVLYLSQNTEELAKVSSMSETDAAVYIATQIAPKALELKPKTTSTPDPHYVPAGKGKVADEDPNLEGCTFE